MRPINQSEAFVRSLLPADQAGPKHESQNAGYSGTPMWKLALERAQRDQAAAASAPAAKIPDGFKPIEQVSETHLPQSKRPTVGRWFYSEKRQVFWNATDLKMYVVDSATRLPAELHEAQTSELRVSVGACFHENASQAKHVLVKDLVKAAQSLRTSIDHIDRPCSIYALYEGHRGTSGNSCADYCAKNLHNKLLLKLAAFRGYWDDRRLQATMLEVFQEIDTEYAAQSGNKAEGCCAVVAFVTGRRLVLASLGDVACVVCTNSGEALVPIKAHTLRPPADDDDDDDDEDDDAVLTGPMGEPLSIKCTRAFGDFDKKTPASVPRLTAIPDVAVVNLLPSHRGVALVCRELYNSIGRSAAVSTVFRRSRGRPRTASGALVDAAVQWLGGQVGKDKGLGSIVAFFDNLEDASGTQAQKRRKIEQASQARFRHILLKHKECKSIVDKVRNKQVKRTRGEAERILRAVLEECEADPAKCTKVFTQRCRELSECTTSLTAGELAGDLGWMKPGKNEAKFGPNFDTVVFALQIGQLSDLIDSDQGIHILLRAA